MRNLGLFLVVVMLISSCSVKRLSVTPVGSERGDAVFGLIVPNNNYGKIEDIHIYSWTQGGELNINRVLIDFNLDKIPTTAKIDKATLSLYFNTTSAYDKIIDKTGNQGQDSIVIRRVISDWNENYVTWNRQPETTEENQVVILRLENPRADYINIDITSITQDIVSNEADNRYGIMVKLYNEKPYNVVFFSSGNHPNAELHPKLNISYSVK